MPLLPPEEVLTIAPFYSKKWGKVLIDTVRPMFLESFQNMYNKCEDQLGVDFAEKVLREQGCDYEIGNAAALDHLPEGPFLTISNHPYGGVDGMILVDLFAHRRDDYKVMVNKLLSYLHALDSNFITVTPTGDEKKAPTKDSISGIRVSLKHVREGHPLGLFPAGAVSDYHPKEGTVSDRPWQDAIVKFVRKLNVPVIPVHFLDGNSKFFYSLGLLDWRIRLLRLPKEVVDKDTSRKGRRVRVVIGDVITPEFQARFESDEDFGDFLRKSVYDLPATDKFIRRSSLGYKQE